EYVDRRDEDDLSCVDLLERAREPFEIIEIVLRVGVGLPLFGARSGADDEVESSTGDLLDIQRVEARVERVLPKEIAADESGVADERRAVVVRHWAITG